VKIAHICFVDTLSIYSGVRKKLSYQEEAWLRAGHQVLSVTVTREPAEPLLGETQGFTHLNFHPSSRLDSEFACLDVARQVQNWAPDLIYCRISTWRPLLHTLFRRYPVVLEINSDFDKEKALVYSKTQYLYYRITKNWYYHTLNGFVCLTPEMAATCTPYGKPICVIGDAIDLSSYAVLNAPCNASPHLFFIGTPDQSWQGLDLVVEMARLRPCWHFDIVGYQQSDAVLSGLPNLTIHGQLAYVDYRKLMEQADVAIGTLALFRKGQRQNCPIKVREYLAHGLPVIIGYEDVDFPMDYSPFLLRLPNEEHNVNNTIDQIDRFVMDWQGKRIDHQMIAHIDSSQKEAVRLSFFAEVIAKKCSPV